MIEFAHVYELLKEASQGNAWITLGIFYGGFFLIGVVLAKVALFIADYVAAIVAILAILFLYQWYIRGAGAYFLLVYPPAWTSWGALIVCGRMGMKLLC
jgi:hypothetical protein